MTRPTTDASSFARAMKRPFPLMAFALASPSGFAYLNGGEFRHEHVSALTHRTELLLHVPVSGTGDLPEGLITTDGDEVPAQSGTPSDYPIGICGGFRIRPYSAEYTFSGPGAHAMSYGGSNRAAGVINIPNPVDTEVFVTAQVFTRSCVGINRSPRFNNP